MTFLTHFDGLGRHRFQSPCRFPLYCICVYLEMAMAEDLDTCNNNITATIMESAVETAGRNKPPRQEKLSRVTRQLREKRRQMKRSGTDVQHIEYTEICKAIRQRMKEEINRYNEEEQLKPLANNTGLMSTKRMQCQAETTSLPLKRKTVGSLKTVTG